MDAKQSEGQVQVDKEAIKTLCKSVGIREGARQLGLPEDRVLKWSSRDPEGPWKPLIQQNGPLRSQQTVITPSNAYDKHLFAQKSKTRSNLAKFTVNASKVAARSRNPVEIAGKVRDVASVMEKIWPEEKGSTGFTLNLGILNQSVK